MATIEITHNYPDVLAATSNVRDAFKRCNFGDVFRKMFGRLHTAHAQMFAGSSGPYGSGWAPLAASTVRRKGHATILVDSKRLLQSLMQESSDSIREVVNTGTQQGMSLGTSVPYSMFHQEGTSRMPRRAHVGVRAQDLDAFAKDVADHVVKCL